MDLWICPTCKAKNNDYEKYCRDCGTWLLSTNSPAKKIEETVSSSKKLKFFYIAELVVILIFGLLIFIGSNQLTNNLSGFLFFSGLMLVGTSIFLTMILLLVKSYKKNKKSMRNHFALALGMTISGLFLSLTDTNSTSTQVSSKLPSLEQYQSVALHLEYRDLTRNADSTYKGEMVHFNGTVYHLVNGKQNYVMIDVTDSSKQYEEVIYVKRKDNAGTLLVGDNVDVYGIVRGIQTTTTFVGIESMVPYIESHYLILKSD